MTDTPERDLISPAMIRAARGLLGLSQADLAEKAKLNQRTVSKVEEDAGSSRDPRRLRVLDTLQETFEAEGVEFIFPGEATGEGVRRRKAD
ncbi:MULTISPECIES: helix-turn-helix domain-containing protein [unclassified Bradyrhizobium]|uniref:helix-turn-helix domain-containing protein n=1 Tax=unclassified Bradyrhizobium TaxID=2631580 RepID=UPI002FF1365B